MAITGIDTIEGKQIIAAGAVSAKSAEMAYNDENGNPITGYQIAGEYYSASNPSGFITGVDLTPYQTTADMTAYQPAGDYLTTADSANFYTTANESGFITGVDLTPYQTVEGMTAYQEAGDYYSASNPSGFLTAHQSLEGYLQDSDLTIVDNKVTEISGVPLSAGDEFPQSATDAIGYVTATSANIDSTIDNVSANSGVWGGSALPVSAGKGVKISLQNDTLIFENDATLLYTTGEPADTINLSEEATNFETLKLELSSHQSPEIVNYTEIKPNASYLTYFANALIPAATYPLQIAGIQFTANNAKDYTMTTGVRMCYKVNETYGDQYSTIATTNIRDVGYITKIWGINRTAGE